jgi:NAD(P)-dependent dehydrogenase (short-subunit alcohol dehydrogenase family)
MTAPAGKTVLIIGASRGLGYALAAKYRPGAGR